MYRSNSEIKDADSAKAMSLTIEHFTKTANVYYRNTGKSVDNIDPLRTAGEMLYKMKDGFTFSIHTIGDESEVASEIRIDGETKAIVKQEVI